MIQPASAIPLRLTPLQQQLVALLNAMPVKRATSSREGAK